MPVKSGCGSTALLSFIIFIMLASCFAKKHSENNGKQKHVPTNEDDEYDSKDKIRKGK